MQKLKQAVAAMSKDIAAIENNFLHQGKLVKEAAVVADEVAGELKASGQTGTSFKD